MLSTAPLICSQRLTLAVLAFFGKFFVYSSRINLSVAILCMVRSDASTNTTHHELGTNRTVFNDSEQDTSTTSVNQGEFDWDKSTQSYLLSMYFYGYIFTQIPGGWLSSRFGGRRVWGFCQLISAICTLLTPVSARTHVYLAYAVRFILGFSAGVTFPAVHALLGRWAPPLERSKLVSYTFAGPSIGMVVTLAISGILCEHGFDNGWGSIFYLCGIFNLIWVIAWFFMTADSPDEHTRITDREKKYIKNAIGKGAVDRKQNIPWVRMFTSRPVWAIVCAHFCNNYTTYTLLTSLPMFMKEALKFDIKQNGLLSSTPYVTQFATSFFMGYMADKFIERRWLRVKNTRKLFQSISLVGPAIAFCGLVQLDSSRRYLAVALLCVCTSMQSANRGGYLVNHLDLAPSYAGIIFGVTNTAATIPGIIAPMIAAALTPNETHEEWRLVFYVCAAVALLGSILYNILGDGELQAWSVTKGALEDAINIDKTFPKEDGHDMPLIVETKNTSGDPFTVG